MGGEWEGDGGGEVRETMRGGENKHKILNRVDIIQSRWGCAAVHQRIPYNSIEKHFSFQWNCAATQIIQFEALTFYDLITGISIYSIASICFYGNGNCKCARACALTRF